MKFKNIDIGQEVEIQGLQLGMLIFRTPIRQPSEHTKQVADYMR